MALSAISIISDFPDELLTVFVSDWMGKFKFSLIL
jgi:hypothetical protein